MRHPILAAVMAACLATLPGCAMLGALTGGPASAASATVVDEKALAAAELAYQASAQAVLLGLETGLITGADAIRAGQLDRDAYGALMVARSAYRAGNSRNWLEALDQALKANDALLALSRK